jgi:acyl carrier protein
MAADDILSEILAEIAGMLVDVVGEEILLVGELTHDTSFNDDLALESIEFVALAERLQNRYGERVDFMAFLAGMDIDEIMGMTLGDLASHLAVSLEPSPTLESSRA